MPASSIGKRRHSYQVWRPAVSPPRRDDLLLLLLEVDHDIHHHQPLAQVGNDDPVVMGLFGTEQTFDPYRFQHEL